MHEPAMIYLLSRQKERSRMEQRALSSVLLASLLLGAFLAWLFANPATLLPVSAVTAWALLCLVRLMGDSGVLQHLLTGHAWREIRLSRLRSEQVVDGIMLFGLKQQMIWSVGPALLMGLLDARFGLPWLGAVLFGSAIASCLGMLAVVQRAVPGFQLRPEAVVWLWISAVGLLFLGGSTSWGMMLVPALLWLTIFLRCCVAYSLDQISEGFSLVTTPARLERERTYRWVPWGDNPIVARECARESSRLSSSWLLANLYFWRWGIALMLAPALYLFGIGPELRERIGLHWAFWGCALLLIAGLLQGLRSAGRVFSALATERDAQTLDLLVVTSLEPEDFVDGWAQVGYSSRQLELILVICASLAFGVYARIGWEGLGMLAWSGLLGLALCVAGAYCGLLFGFRHCGRIKRKRHLVFPAGLFAWVVLTLGLFPNTWQFLPLQGLVCYLVIQSARRQSLATLRG